MTIYVLRSDNLVKIGFTENLRARVASIIGAIPIPVEIVGHMPGDKSVEKHFHDRFAAHHFSGEWFVCTAAMMTVFDAILTPGLPAIELEKKPKRVGSDADAISAKSILRDFARRLWPETKHAERIASLALMLGWNRSRVKDLYYGDPRTAMRAFEIEELSSLLASDETAARGAAKQEVK